jgi:hypothetical protein
MRTVVRTAYGVLELNWMWLPTFIGMNASLKKEMETSVANQFKGRPMSDQTLAEAHKAVCDFLVAKYPSIIGLDRVLDGLKFVELKDERRTPTSSIG